MLQVHLCENFESLECNGSASHSQITTPRTHSHPYNPLRKKMIDTITNALISFALSSLPHIWQFILGFILGIMFCRKMLRDNPEHLQALVDLASESGVIAKAVLVKIEAKVDAAGSALKDSQQGTKAP